MARKGDVEIDMRSMQKAMEKWASVVEEGAGDVVKDEARLFYIDAMRTTEPRTKAKGGKRVERDILKTMRPLPTAGNRSPWVARLVKAKDEQAWQEYLDRTVNKRSKTRVVAGRFDKRHHKGQRNHRGQVTRASRRVQMTTPRDQARLRRHIADEKKKIGLFKAAYAQAAAKCGGKVPAWIARQQPKALAAFGNVIVRADFDGQKPGITVAAPSLDVFKNALPRLVSRRTRSMMNKYKLWIAHEERKINTKFTLRS